MYQLNQIPTHLHCQQAIFSESGLTYDEQVVIEKAKAILVRHMATVSINLDSPIHVKNYLTLLLSGSEREEFVALWLNTKNQLIKSETLFVGTINSTAVYPREIIKSALACNAGALIIAHNHPSSGDVTPSDADKRMTEQIKMSLSNLEVRLLDHIIVSGMKSMSFAEEGLL